MQLRGKWTDRIAEVNFSHKLFFPLKTKRRDEEKDVDEATTLLGRELQPSSRLSEVTCFTSWFQGMSLLLGSFLYTSLPSLWFLFPHTASILHKITPNFFPPPAA